MRRCARLSAALLAAAVVVGGCGADARVEEAPPPAASAPARDTAWRRCENAAAGFAVRVPAAWHAATLGPAGACRWFHPDAVDVVANSDCCPGALEVSLVEEPLERIVAGYADPVHYRVRAREEVAAPRRAVRLSVETTGRGLFEEGTRIAAWVLEHGEGAAVVQAVALPGEGRFEEWARVVDEAARTLELAPPGGAGAAVRVFFANDRLRRDELSCGEVFPRERHVARGLTARERLAAALAALLAGPTADERAAGYSSWFSRETAGTLRAVAVLDGGVVRVDFDDFSALLNGASTSCGSASLSAALDATVRAEVGGARPVYSFRGDCGAFSEWLQASPPPCPPLPGSG